LGHVEIDKFETCQSLDPPDNQDFNDTIQEISQSLDQALCSFDVESKTNATCPLRLAAYQACHTNVIKILEQSEAFGLVQMATLLRRIQNEWTSTHEALKTLYESSVSFGINKALAARQEHDKIRQKVKSLTLQNSRLQDQLKEGKNKIKLITLRAKEQRSEEKRGLQEELEKLRERNDRIQQGLENFVLHGHEEISSYIMHSKSQ
jgi:dynein light intermediate chain